MENIYLDYAASTPVDPRVRQAMEPYFSEKFGNPGSLHSFGQETMAAVDASREVIAKSINSGFREVIFTGSATEANNLALRGAIKKLRIKNSELRGKNPQSSILNPRIIVSSIEHESVLETARDLERDGVEVIYLQVDRRGVVDFKKLESALDERTVLVSVMYANNEIGTIQPIAEIAKVVKEFRMENSELRGRNPQSSILNPQSLPLFHTDAVQAFQFLDCDIKKLGVDLMTLSAHKIYGPKGVGALYIRNSKHETLNPKQILSPKFQKISDLEFRNSKLPVMSALITGGGQEFGLRSGTENVPAIVGFAKAAELLFSNSQEHWNKEIAGLRDRFWLVLKKIVPNAELNGDLKNSLPNILNVYFPRHKAEVLLTKLDLAGLAASSGSACGSRAAKSSYVIGSMGHPDVRARQSIRFSFGRPTTKEEVDGALEILKRCLGG